MTTSYFDALQGEQFVVLTSYRRSGDKTPTTVWFAQDGDNLYVTTNRAAGKVKRILANPLVHLAPSDRVGNVHGPALDGQARLLPPEESERAITALRQKYGQQYDALTAQMDAQSPPGSRVFIEIAPPQGS